MTKGEIMHVEPPSGIDAGMGRYAVVRDTEGTEVGLRQNTPEPAAAG